MKPSDQDYLDAVQAAADEFRAQCGEGPRDVNREKALAGRDAGRSALVEAAGQVAEGWLMRDGQRPAYGFQERRVCEYLRRITDDQIGCGMDPIGFLMASHEALVMRVAELEGRSVTPDPSSGT